MVSTLRLFNFVSRTLTLFKDSYILPSLARLSQSPTLQVRLALSHLSLSLAASHILTDSHNLPLFNFVSHTLPPFKASCSLPYFGRLSQSHTLQFRLSHSRDFQCLIFLQALAISYSSVSSPLISHPIYQSLAISYSPALSLSISPDSHSISLSRFIAYDLSLFSLVAQNLFTL